jgi:DinB superfamily
MTAPTTPYTPDLAGRNPLVAMRETSERVRALAGKERPDWFERSYAPGKWSARQVLIHLAQTEMALGTRARLALSTPAYAAQAFDQDSWMKRESGMSGAEALAAFLAIARMNVVFFEGLTSADRAIELSHPEYGELTVDWIIHQLAGHQIHHLQQLEHIGP